MSRRMYIEVPKYNALLGYCFSLLIHPCHMLSVKAAREKSPPIRHITSCQPSKPFAIVAYRYYLLLQSQTSYP